MEEYERIGSCFHAKADFEEIPDFCQFLRNFFEKNEGENDTENDRIDAKDFGFLHYITI